jgi:sugar-specific transcriptional regulator TrmB
MTKYKEYMQKMLHENREIFDEFKKIHDNYALNSNGLQEEFNKQGEKILEVVREYENRLCSNTERGMYNKFSTGLAQKFQDEVRKEFPMIDHVGLKIQADSKPSFFIKKIKLT